MSRLSDYMISINDANKKHVKMERRKEGRTGESKGKDMPRQGTEYNDVIHSCLGQTGSCISLSLSPGTRPGPARARSRCSRSSLVDFDAPRRGILLPLKVKERDFGVCLSISSFVHVPFVFFMQLLFFIYYLFYSALRLR